MNNDRCDDDDEDDLRNGIGRIVFSLFFIYLLFFFFTRSLHY